MDPPRPHHPPSPPLPLRRSRLLRRDQTDAENKLWFSLRARRLEGVKFRRQHRVGPYIADFCCLECRLVVEIDGGQHAEETEAEREQKKFLAAKGFRVLRLWNHDVLTSIDVVLEEIRRAVSV